MKPTVVALVPMRHESLRVPGKNYRDFLGRPLYEYILDTLQACPRIDRIVVDTDSPAIHSGIAKSHPKVGLVDRPERLRAATIPMTAVLLHDVTEVPADFYLQTHCTNPLLTTDTVNRCIDEFLGAHPVYDSLFSVTARRARLWDAAARPVNHDPALLLRTQDLPKMYEENSCLYMFSREALETRHSRIGSRPLLFPIDRMEALDIDEEIDFTFAEALCGLTRTNVAEDLYYFGHHKCATHWMRRFLKPICRDLRYNYKVGGGRQPNGAATNSYQRTFFLFVNSRTKDIAGLPERLRGFHLIRDPRDAFVSNYFSRRYSHPIHSENQEELRHYLNEHDLEEGLVHLLRDDDAFRQMEDWDSDTFPNVMEVKYEELLADEFAVFSRILAHLGITVPQRRLRKIITKCSFERLSGGREPGEEDAQHHYRKGVAGDWTNHMPPGSRAFQEFDQRYGHLVEKFGYER